MARRHDRGAYRPTGGAAGFTLMEIITALVLIGLVYAMAVPSIRTTRLSAAVYNSRSMVISSISLARATAIRYGRLAVLRLDSSGDRIWIEADTTASSSGVVDTLGLVNFGDGLKVDLWSNRSALCFNGRGIGSTGSACPVAGAVIVVSLQDRADTVVVSSVGRVLP